MTGLFVSGCTFRLDVSLSLSLFCWVCKDLSDLCFPALLRLFPLLSKSFFFFFLQFMGPLNKSQCGIKLTGQLNAVCSDKYELFQENGSGFCCFKFTFLEHLSCVRAAVPFLSCASVDSFNIKSYKRDKSTGVINVANEMWDDDDAQCKWMRSYLVCIQLGFWVSKTHENMQWPPVSSMGASAFSAHPCCSFHFSAVCINGQH